MRGARPEQVLLENSRSISHFIANDLFPLLVVDKCRTILSGRFRIRNCILANQNEG